MGENKAVGIIMKGAVISLFFGIIGFILMFFFRLIAARYYGPEKFGFFELGNTLMNVMGLISLFGVHSGISRYIAVYEARKEHEKLRGYLDFIFRLPVIASIIFSIAVYLFSDQINGFFNFGPAFLPIVKIIALSIPFRVLTQIVYQIFFAKRKILIQGIASNIIERVTLLIAVVFAYFFGFSIYFIIWALFASVFISSLYSLFYYRFSVRFGEFTKKIYYYKDWLSFSLPLFLAGISAFFINWTDNLIIGKFLTSQNLGVYAISFSLASFLLFFQTSFVGIFIPVMSKLYAEERVREFFDTYKKSQNWVFGMALPFAIFFIFFAKPLIVSLYGNAYEAGALPLIILSAGLLYNVYTGMNMAVIKIAKKTLFLFKTKLFFAIFNVILSIILVLKYGINGVAFSTAISIIGEQTIYYFKSRKIFDISHDNIKNIKLIIVSFILVLVMLIFYNKIGQSELLGVLLTGITFLILYFYTAFALKIFSEDDISIAKSILKRSYEK